MKKANHGASAPWFRQPDNLSTANSSVAEATNTTLSPQPAKPHSRVIVVGAGLAGCCTAFQLRHQGYETLLLDSAPEPATAASGNSAAVLRPHVTRQATFSSDFFVAGFMAMLALIEQVDIQQDLFKQSGVLQLLYQAEAYPTSDLYQQLNSREVETFTGVPGTSTALLFKTAGWVDIPGLCRRLIETSRTEVLYDFKVDGLERSKNTWRITGWQKKQALQAQHVVLANGCDLEELLQRSGLAATTDLPVIPARGQTTTINTNQPHSLLGRLKMPICGKQTLIPMEVNGINCLQLGSTYQRNCSDASIRAADTAENLSAVQYLLHGTSPVSNRQNENHHLLSTPPHSQWAGVRATTPDRLPMVGPVPDFASYHREYGDLQHGRPMQNYPDAHYYPGLYMNGAYGSRGLTIAALAASLIAQSIISQSPGNSAEHTKPETRPDWHNQYQQRQKLLELVHPARFLIRQLKKA